MARSRRILVACALLLPLGWGVQRLAALRPDLVERLYSRGVYPTVAAALRALSGRVPFSVAEALIGLALVLALARASRLVRRARAAGSARGRLGLAGRGALELLAAAGVLHALYLAAWGLNHQRQPFAVVAGWDTSTPTPDELETVASSLVAELERLRPTLPEDEAGVSRMPHDARELERLAREAFAACAGVHPSLEAAPGATKRPLASALLSSWWISGVYSPWTGEAHVNAELPDPYLGFTTCHELAHGLGFAREDEASFVAVLACSRSDDAALRYSGAFTAARYALRALESADPERAARVVGRIGDGVRRDELALQAFWTRKRSLATDVARHVNDGYLKSQGQRLGTASYGRVVDLLVARHREGVEAAHAPEDGVEQ